MLISGSTSISHHIQGGKEGWEKAEGDEEEGWGSGKVTARQLAAYASAMLCPVRA